MKNEELQVIMSRLCRGRNSISDGAQIIVATRDASLLSSLTFSIAGADHPANNLFHFPESVLDHPKQSPVA